MRKISYFLRNKMVCDNACRHIQNLQVNEDKPMVVSIQEYTRSLDQNAKFHAICSDMSKSAQYMGRTLTAVQWKVLLISGHAIATKIGADVIPGIEGEFVNIRESSASMGVARMSSLIEYSIAYAVSIGVKLSDGGCYVETN